MGSSPIASRAISIVSRARSRGEAKKALGLIKTVDLASDKTPQRSADRARLLAPTRVERNVELSLQAVLGVIGRLAVAHEDEAMRKFRHAETIP